MDMSEKQQFSHEPAFDANQEQSEVYTVQQQQQTERRSLDPKKRASLKNLVKKIPYVITRRFILKQM
jgi:hypothetical protein